MKSFTKPLCALFLCAMGSAPGGAMAQAPTVVTSLQNVLQLSATHTVEVPQDTLSMSLSTTREGADAATVQAELSKALESALAELRPAVQPGQLEVFTGGMGLYPRNDKDGKLNGWQGSAELMVEGRDIARITAATAKVRSLSIARIGFDLSREQRLKTEAEVQATALEQFKAKAASLAKGFGFGSYTLREVTVAPGEAHNPIQMRAGGVAYTTVASKAVPLEAGRTAVSVTVSGSVQMQ